MIVQLGRFQPATARIDHPNHFDIITIAQWGKATIGHANDPPTHLEGDDGRRLEFVDVALGTSGLFDIS